MPRQSRIDSPGEFNYIIARGIERKKIFADGVLAFFIKFFIKQINMKSVQYIYS